MKKKTKVLISLIVLLIVTVGIFIGISLYRESPTGQIATFNTAYNSRTYVNDKDFNDCYEDFCTIVDIAVSYGDQLDESDYYFMVGVDGDVMYMSYDGDRVELNKNEEQSLRRIDEAFKQSSFDVIWVYKDRISFDIYNDYYSLVYSFDDSQPTYIPGLEYMEVSYNVQKIRKNWYHITGNPE